MSVYVCKYHSYGLLSRVDMNNLIAISGMKVGEFFQYIALNQGTLSLIAKGEKKFTEGNIRLLIKVFETLEPKIAELKNLLSLALAKDFYAFQEAVQKSELKILYKKIPNSTTLVTIKGFATGPTWFCKKVNKYHGYLESLYTSCVNYEYVMRNLHKALEQLEESGDYEL